MMQKEALEKENFDKQAVFLTSLDRKMKELKKFHKKQEQEHTEKVEERHKTNFEKSQEMRKQVKNEAS